MVVPYCTNTRRGGRVLKREMCAGMWNMNYEYIICVEMEFGSEQIVRMGEEGGGGVILHIRVRMNNFQNLSWKRRGDTKKVLARRSTGEGEERREREGRKSQKTP